MGILRWLRGEGGDGPEPVVLRENVSWHEAVMIRGLLEGAEIAVSTVTLDSPAPPRLPVQAQRFRLLVYADRLDEAEALLAAPPSRGGGPGA